jgi:hypothetical protein
MTGCHAGLIGCCLMASFISSCDPAAAEIAATPNPPSKGEVACPSREFSKFLDAFSEDVRIQKRFTRFPLEYRYLDAHLIGTEKENDAAKKQMIPSFEKIPFRFGKGESAGIFPNRIERKKKRLATKVVTPENGKASSDDKTLLLFEPDTGNNTYYRFRRDKACWSLYLIDSQSL